MSVDRVPNEGSRTAPIVLIGEAPGKWEHEYGRPFVGPSYTDRLLPWWRDAGLTREAVYITNVLDFDPVRAGYHGHGPDDPAINHVPESIMRAAMDALHARLAEHEGPDGRGPVVIVPTGNYALYALTGKGRVSFHARDGKWARPGIQAWRGSILEYEDRRGRRIKVIPTVHPAATLPYRTPGLQWVCRHDWARIAQDATFRELRLPDETHLTTPSRASVLEWIRWTRERAAAQAAAHAAWIARYGAAEALRQPWDAIPRRLVCSLDVETPKRTTHRMVEGVSTSTAPGTKCRMCGHARRWHGDSAGDPGACQGPRGGGCAHACPAFAPPLLKPKRVTVSDEAYLACVGYAWDPTLSLTIPTTAAYWPNPEDWDVVREAMRAFHADPNIDFGGQNFTQFDCWWLWREGMPIANPAWDLRKMHSIRVPWSEWHDLAFQASLWLRTTYWKDEAKDPESVQRYAQGQALFEYNGMDNCRQRALFPLHWEALREGGRLEYYYEREAPVDVALIELSRTGIRVDLEGRRAECARVRQEAAALAEEINRLAGCALVATTSVSDARLKAWLYGDGMSVKQYDRPRIASTAKAAKCGTCGHGRGDHDPDDGACRKMRRGEPPQPCDCQTFVPPMKYGKRVCVGETKTGGLRLPVQYRRVKGQAAKRVTADVIAIKRLLEQFPAHERLQAVGTRVLRHRRLLKIASSLSEAKVAPDGRVYGLFRQDTALGRLSCGAPPCGPGDNLQNQDRKLRQFYLPDRDEDAACGLMILLSVDLSQVEARIELMLAAGTPEFAGTDVARECIRLATAHPSEFDIHTWVAAVALNKSEADITDIAPPGGSEPSDRQIGKTTGHGFFRGMRAQTMSDQLLKMGYVVTPETCQLRLDRIAAKLPAIPQGYFLDCQRQVLRYGGLATTYGAIARYDEQRFDEALYGVVYSFPPQRETVDLLDHGGYLPLYNAIALRRRCPIPGRPAPRLHIHGHDSLTLSVHPEDAWSVAAFLDRTLGRVERRYAAGTLRMPVTYAIGETWKARYTWNRLPTRRELRDAAYDCAARAK